MAWTPKILSEFEIGQAMAAIEAVARLEKPLAQVGCRIASASDLEADLLACVNDAGESGRVFPWLRRRDDRLWYGFYAQPWVLRALDFLDASDLDPADRHWINGLLFGYRASAIQRFVEANGGVGGRTRSPLTPNRTSDIPENARPREEHALRGN